MHRQLIVVGRYYYRMTIKKILTVCGTAGVAVALAAAVTVNASASVGGTPVSDAPWAAQVNVSGFCSGSIVAPHWVATAAHCTGDNDTGTVLVGSVHRGQGQPANVVQVHRNGDFALLRLDRDINTQYLKIATRQPEIGAFPTGSGWGYPCHGDEQCDLAKTLLATKMKIVGLKHGGFFNMPFIDTHDTGNGLPTRGDSGGPLVLDGQLLGTLSIIYADPQNGQFHAEYADLASMTNWISSVTGGELPGGNNPPSSGNTIRSNWNGKCIDVPASNFADGQRLGVWDCHGGANQRWEFVNGAVRTQNNMCMDVAWGSHDNGAAIQIATCSGNGAQRFVLNQAGDLVNPQSDKCVDIAGWNGNNGAPLHLWQCVGSANQKWRRA